MQAARMIWALPLAAALALAGCGGGDSAGTPADRQAAVKPIAVGEPNGSNVDTGPFIKLARESGCADLHNRLYIIDKSVVFHSRAGKCADNSYANNLYGLTPDKLLCSQYDSIAGPQTRCTDDKYRALFQTIVNNLDAANLGLDASHEVKKVDLGQPGIEVTELSHISNSGVDVQQNLVIKDPGAFNTIWEQHTGNSSPAPRIDFNRGMVLAVFAGSRPNACYGTRIAQVTASGGKIVVTREDTAPGEGIACAMLLTSPAHLVLIERSELPVEFVTTQKQR